jgi:SnoaL-like protein
MHLPPPIDLYVKAENAGDVESLSECFAPDAIVRDESHTYEGLAAIKEWKAETKKKYSHAVAPLEVADRDGKTVLKARVSGNFPGSPVTLEFSFVLEGGKIASLEIYS